MSYPDFQKALKVTKDTKHLELQQIPLFDTALQPYQILVKVIAAGVNHVDNKILDNGWATEGTGFGVTTSGIVLEIGQKVTRFQKGDTISSFQFGADAENKDQGSFQEYTKVLESQSIRFELKSFGSGDLVPYGPIDTFEKAAAFTNVIITNGIALYHQFQAINNGKKKTILIYGGSTGVGEFAVQYSHYIGWRVIAIASSGHHERLKKEGADVLLTYHSDNLAQDIKDLNEDIDFAYVTNGGEKALKEVYDALPLNKKIKLESIDYPNIDFITDKNPNIEFGYTRAFTSHGQKVKFKNFEFEPYPGTLESIKKWINIVEELHKEGFLQTREIRIIPAGLNGVSTALKLLKDGAARERLVVRVDKAD
ncbi:hypothetical protein WICMUC_000558 [Wickerhamomyces mucosus]|uniref:Enoyl reductase (ER) domain-containing protein n=1 Tax=Wickerhamomyces mucosus TaxID=1378264 RepID=A0A9P8PYX2_9ASCO|nr:hypothetical protein WICMUC_000558 [Wickerhamomyces mucosus]